MSTVEERALQVNFPEKFELAAAFEERVCKIDDDACPLPTPQRLLLYALKQQAKHGKSTDPAPSWWNPRERAKWDAWNEVSGMHSFEAMVFFVKTLEDHHPAWLVEQLRHAESQPDQASPTDSKDEHSPTQTILQQQQEHHNQRQLNPAEPESGSPGHQDASRPRRLSRTQPANVEPLVRINSTLVPTVQAGSPKPGSEGLTNESRQDAGDANSDQKAKTPPGTRPDTPDGGSSGMSVRVKRTCGSACRMRHPRESCARCHTDWGKHNNHTCPDGHRGTFPIETGAVDTLNTFYVPQAAPRTPVASMEPPQDSVKEVQNLKYRLTLALQDVQSRDATIFELRCENDQLRALLALNRIPASTTVKTAAAALQPSPAEPQAATPASAHTPAAAGRRLYNDTPTPAAAAAQAQPRSSQVPAAPGPGQPGYYQPSPPLKASWLSWFVGAENEKPPQPKHNRAESNSSLI
ncbi:Acyl-CoA-binding domain-containing protein 5 [Diplonema papillatum]|nr:Acyl-CoA-binding domain-containing protein 5 [Diplonema papillatum]